MNLRKAVIAPPPDFEFRDHKSGKLLSYNLEGAIRWISKHPSLSLKFSEIAFRRIDFLESSLWLNHSLPNSIKTQFRLELLHLENDDKPLWESAIRWRPQAAPKLISSTIRTWMNEQTNQ